MKNLNSKMRTDIQVAFGVDEFTAIEIMMDNDYNDIKNSFE